MKLRTKRIEEWIIIEGADPGEKAEFLVHPLSPKEVNAMLEKVKIVEWDKGQRFVDHNFYKFKLLKIFATIIKWKGVEDEDGNELGCIDANKEIIYLGNSELIDQVLEKADALYKAVQESVEKEAKNSLPAPDGTATLM
jgi:hypothetical protein